MTDLSISPATLLILLLGLAFGALCHLWRGRSWSDLALYLALAFAGLGLGQVLGPLLGLDLLRIGQVYLLEGAVLAWLLMLAVAWLKR